MVDGLLLSQDEAIEHEEVEAGTEKHPDRVTRRADHRFGEPVERGFTSTGTPVACPNARCSSRNRSASSPASGMVCTRRALVPIGRIERKRSRSRTSYSNSMKRECGGPEKMPGAADSSTETP